MQWNVPAPALWDWLTSSLLSVALALVNRTSLLGKRGDDASTMTTVRVVDEVSTYLPYQLIRPGFCASATVPWLAMWRGEINRKREIHKAEKKWQKPLCSSDRKNLFLHKYSKTLSQDLPIIWSQKLSPAHRVAAIINVINVIHASISLSGLFNTDPRHCYFRPWILSTPKILKLYIKGNLWCRERSRWRCRLSRAPNTCYWSGFPNQSNQPYHPSGVDELVPNC